MDLSNNDKATVSYPPINTGKVKPMPAHASEQQFMGEDMGVKGRMGDYSTPLAKEE